MPLVASPAARAVGCLSLSPLCSCLLSEHDPRIPIHFIYVFQQFLSLNPNKFPFCSSLNWLLLLVTKCSHWHINASVPACSQFPCALFSLGLSQLAVRLESYLTNYFTLKWERFPWSSNFSKSICILKGKEIGNAKKSKFHLTVSARVDALLCTEKSGHWVFACRARVLWTVWVRRPGPPNMVISQSLGRRSTAK